MGNNGKVVLHCALYIVYCKPEISLFAKQCWEILKSERRTEKNKTEVFGQSDLVSISIHMSTQTSKRNEITHEEEKKKKKPRAMVQHC